MKLTLLPFIHDVFIYFIERSIIVVT